VDQLSLFQKKEVTTPETVMVTYVNSDFNGAIAAAHEAHGNATVIAVPAGCKLMPKKKRRGIK
jgi:hypothetical protein